jgi:hypothetical protein
VAGACVQADLRAHWLPQEIQNIWGLSMTSSTLVDSLRQSLSDKAPDVIKALAKLWATLVLVMVPYTVVVEFITRNPYGVPLQAPLQILALLVLRVILLCAIEVILLWGVVVLFSGVKPGFAQSIWPFRVPTDGSKTLELATILEHASSNADELLLIEKHSVVAKLEERIAQLRVATRTILGVIGMALLAGALVVLFAGSLTSLDASAVSNVDRLKFELEDSRRRVGQLYRVQSLYNQIERKDATDKDRKDAKEALERLTSFRDLRGGDDPTSAVAAQTMIQTQMEQMRILNDFLAKAWEKELNAERGYSDWHYIGATAITRVGVVLIIVYLVQILLSLYRYNTRLASYYNSRRDLLILWDGKQRGLKSLDEILTSAKIDFGREPKHPLEDLIRVLGSKLGTTLSRRKSGETGENKSSRD